VGGAGCALLAKLVGLAELCWLSWVGLAELARLRWAGLGRL
jgi:hypothetical protein